MVDSIINENYKISIEKIGPGKFIGTVAGYKAFKVSAEGPLECMLAVMASLESITETLQIHEDIINEYMSYDDDYELGYEQ